MTGRPERIELRGAFWCGGVEGFLDHSFSRGSIRMVSLHGFVLGRFNQEVIFIDHLKVLELEFLQNLMSAVVGLCMSQNRGLPHVHDSHGSVSW